MNTFQTIVLGIFGFFIIAGLAVIAINKSRDSGEGKVMLTLWGSAPSAVIDELSKELFLSKALKVSYREFPAEGLDRELIEAIAAGRGPDMVLLPLELLLRYRDKLFPISYETYSERQFKDSFIQAGDAFLFPEGILALPFSVDPLIMYWNRNLFDEGGVATAPRYWDEFLLLPNRLTRRDAKGNFSRSAVALGEFKNINGAKEIILALLLQSGSSGGSMQGGFPTLLRSDSGAARAVDFYTEFSNPSKVVYSWNRGQPSSRQAFLASRLAIYFGFGSELPELRRGNPNLNFDAAHFPRPRDAQVSFTYGKMTGVAVLRSAQNIGGALQATFLLASPAASSLLSGRTGLPPVQRSLLGKAPADAFGSVLYDSALRSRGFLDPNPTESSPVFQELIESITGGRAKASSALVGAEARLRGLVR
ncbi:MAG: sn-glycerol 3-phosphate transport system substrate-binding protein [Parcubacteria group bacterium Greene0416_79]|nr:MAG: sn-glycerol 3-phosphate transport system substrate-binding protein [Parcubacteria group bacterium Greene0416_79]